LAPLSEQFELDLSGSMRKRNETAKEYEGCGKLLVPGDRGRLADLP
jgi:hypothetical protein